MLTHWFLYTAHEILLFYIENSFTEYLQQLIITENEVYLKYLNGTEWNLIESKDRIIK